MIFSCTSPTLLKDEESVRDDHVLDRFSNKPFLVWLLTTPPHLKYVAKLSCNLSLMACFADINVSQGSVATYAKCGGIFTIFLTANLPRNLPVIFLNRLRFDRIMVMSLWPAFWPILSIYLKMFSYVARSQLIPHGVASDDGGN